MSSHTAKRALRQAATAISRTSVVQKGRKPIPSYALRCRTRSSSCSVSSFTRRLHAGLASRNHSTIAAEQRHPSIMPEIHARDTYDIVIIGAGNAGLALACTLLSKPALMRDDTRILLVEGGSLDRVRLWSGKGDWENRVSSLTAENVQFLRDIGAWDHIEGSRPCPISDIIVSPFRQQIFRCFHDVHTCCTRNLNPKVWTSNGSSSSSSSQIHFPQPDTNSPMAYMTENTNLQRALLRKIELDGKDRIVIQEGKRVEEMRMGQGGRWVGLRFGNDWVRGGVVVGADGFNSPVRAFSDIACFGHGYDTHAIVATLHHSPLHNHTAFQRFLPTGPIAFLPLSHDSTTLVWSTRPELAAAYKALGPTGLATMINLGFFMSEQSLAAVNTQILAAHAQGEQINLAILDDQWNNILNNLTAEQAKSLPPPIASVAAKSIASFPLKLSHAESYIGDRTVLVGDAAHTIHPLAGQGLNMGLADVKVLGEVWERVKSNGGDLGAYTSLLPYTRERYPANHLLLSTTDKLHYLFGTRIPGINWARSVGMDVINELGPIKKLLMGRVGAQASATANTESPMRPAGSIYEKAADGMDTLRNVKTIAGMAASAGRELVKGGARQLLERLAK